MEAKLRELKETFPGRESQIDQLYSFFGYKDEPFPPSVYIYGGPSTGKSTVVTALLHCLEIRYAVVNMVECYNPRILFESILNQLSGHEIDPKIGTPYARCDNFMDFCNHLQTIGDNIDLSESVVLIDKAEELRSMEQLLPAFLRFDELTDIPITVIFLSDIVFEKYYYKLNVVEPIKMHFPQYSKEELSTILAMDFDYVRTLIDNEFEFGPDFYRNYLNVFLSVFYRVCRDLSELRHMSRINFVKYCEPVINKRHKPEDVMALWRHISPILKNSLEVLYLRVSSNSETKLLTSVAHNIELPFYAKYLLIAAYLASYNPTKDDKRLFMKLHGKKVKTKTDVKKKSKVSEQLNTQMGPKPFTFDRLLAIFYSILDDKVGFNNHILVQISSLVRLQLLSQVSDTYALDGRKYKCNVNFECIQSVAKMVGFNIRKYLSDFSHM
ncbi:origin recognition complex subunit 5 [Cylas formicarius]|uniref:origin recognition complex subunit 5 n=1 Tax=Cylas formicarius TaxID=197179 RepID=UPI002958604F|nr:origin recognition complex subunit 5 [Cylas formicarius]